MIWQCFNFHWKICVCNKSGKQDKTKIFVKSKYGNTSFKPRKSRGFHVPILLPFFSWKKEHEDCSCPLGRNQKETFVQLSLEILLTTSCKRVLLCLLAKDVLAMTCVTCLVRVFTLGDCFMLGNGTGYQISVPYSTNFHKVVKSTFTHVIYLKLIEV